MLNCSICMTLVKFTFLFTHLTLSLTKKLFIVLNSNFLKTFLGNYLKIAQNKIKWSLRKCFAEITFFLLLQKCLDKDNGSTRLRAPPATFFHRLMQIRVTVKGVKGVRASKAVHLSWVQNALSNGKSFVPRRHWSIDCLSFLMWIKK